MAGPCTVPSRTRRSRTISLIRSRMAWLGAISPALARASGESASQRAAPAPAGLSDLTSTTLSPSFAKARFRPSPGGARSAPGEAAAAMATVAEMEVEAAAGPGAWNEEFVLEKARWRLPEGMVRHEGDADPAGLRILRVRGNSMEPEMREGDRLVVDTARRVPAAGELFVLWDGDGLVVKRVEPAREPGPPKLRLLSANPDYPPYTRLVDDIHVVGKVLWKITRM